MNPLASTSKTLAPNWIPSSMPPNRFPESSAPVCQVADSAVRRSFSSINATPKPLQRQSETPTRISTAPLAIPASSAAPKALISSRLDCPTRLPDRFPKTKGMQRTPRVAFLFSLSPPHSMERIIGYFGRTFYLLTLNVNSPMT